MLQVLLRRPASVAVVLLAGLVPVALATDGAVYTMTNSPLGNEVLVFQRSETAGTLTPLVTVATDGTGSGTSLGNQGALALSDDEKWLLVVNPGSSTISSFAVNEDGLQLVDTELTGGRFPISVDVYGDFVAVLNAGGSDGDKDTVTLLLLNPDGTLGKLRGSRRLSADATEPAQVAFIQEGHVLVVTEKATAKIDTLCVRRNGTLGKAQFQDVGGKPFGFVPVSRDRVIVTDAMLGTVTTYQVDTAGTLDAMSMFVNTTQQETCWAVATPGDRFIYATNTQSGTVSGVHLDFDGTLTLLDPTGVSATGAAEPIDAALSGDGRFLYVLASGADAIDVYATHDDGTLTPVESVPGLPDGANGLLSR